MKHKSMTKAVMLGILVVLLAVPLMAVTKVERGRLDILASFVKVEHMKMSRSVSGKVHTQTSEAWRMAFQWQSLRLLWAF